MKESSNLIHLGDLPGHNSIWNMFMSRNPEALLGSFQRLRLV